jgi:gamma-glutamylcyclotransferase (GGCT)/AIG2-like uncharacterized protein YtfP
MQTSERQMQVLGRTITGRQDILKGFKLIEKQGIDAPFAVKSTDPENVVEGTLYNISFVDLFHLDEYEQQFNTTRIKAELESGMMAWIYIDSLN